MNALQSYSSDEELTPQVATKMNKVMSDLGTNYDDVGMDISEDSGDEADNAEQSKSSKLQQSSNNGNSSNNGKTNADPPKSDRTSHSKSDSGPQSRSSVQERLMDLASGSSSSSSDKSQRRSSTTEDRERNSSYNDDRHSHRRRSRSRSRERSRRKSPERKSRHYHDSRRNRRSRSRSRERRRTRSKSRDRDRRSRSRSRERRRRSRSRSRERRRPIDLRKEAQQKLAALKASNPELTPNELLKRSMEAQAAEVQRQTGIALPSYYNPATMNPTKFAEQERKKKLLWGNKDKTAGTGGENKTLGYSFVPAQKAETPESNNQSAIGVHGGAQAALWASTKFSNDSDGKVAEKFRRLMGVKTGDAHEIGNRSSYFKGGAPPAAPNSNDYGAGPKGKGDNIQGPSKAPSTVDQMQRQESMFHNMEKQYEMARLATHTQRGFGLGFSSQPYIPK